MAERLAALGIKAPSRPGETAQQRREREQKEHQDRLRKAEEEDARRDAERQRRLESEQITPPTTGKSASKKPPPPPSRKNKVEAHQAVDAESKKAEHDAAEYALREQQEEQAAETSRMEYVC